MTQTTPGTPLPAGSPRTNGGGLAANLRGFSPIGILVSLLILALGSLGGLPVLVWARLSSTPWRDLGFRRPTNLFGTAAIGIGFGCSFKLLMKTIVMPLLAANPVNPTYHFLAGNRAALPGMVMIVLFQAGFGEETVFRGFLFERLGRLFGRGAGAKAAMVLLSATLFGLAHIHDQGRAGAVQATIVGLVFGAIFATTGELWMLMVAHAAFDLTAVAIIYWNLESWVAHLVFR